MALKDSFSRSTKNILGHLIQGLLVLAPLAITLYVFYKIFYFIHTTFHFVGVIVYPLIDPFIIVFAILLFIYLIGRLSSSFLFTPVRRLEKDIERVPLIRVVYSSVKDLLSAFMGNKRKFNRPVLVTMDKANCIKQLGFITQDNLSALKIEKEYIAVYLPFSYGLSGKVIVTHKDNVEPIDASAAEVMKFIVSGGVTHVD